MTISIIVAVSQNGVIGINNQLPWRLAADLKRFKEITMGHSIIMGRKTFESIGKPLPGRINIVVTRNPKYKAEGIQTAHNLESGVKNCKDPFIIGGAGLFSEGLKLADQVYLTRIYQDFEGDVTFPLSELEENFELTQESQKLTSEENLIYQFQIFNLKSILTKV